MRGEGRANLVLFRRGLSVSPSVSLPLRLGLIGCGRIVRRVHVPAYRALEDLVHVHTIADPSEQSRQELTALIPVPRQRRYADCRDMLARENLDAVVIATPHHLHAEGAVAAVIAGVPVLCEKPLASGLRQGEEILRAAAKTETPVSVIHNFLFTPAVQRARTCVRTGALGAPAAGRALSLFRKSPEARDAHRTWRASTAAGGGCLNDTTYHEFYLLEALVDSPIRTVQGYVKSAFGTQEVDDLVFLLLEHENGAVSSVCSSWGIPDAGGGAQGNVCEVYGQGGALRVVRRGQGLFRYSETAPRWQRVALPEVDDLPEPERRRVGHLNFFRETFSALARGERTLPVGGEHARHMLAVLEAARNARPDRPPVHLCSRG